MSLKIFFSATCLLSLITLSPAFAGSIGGSYLYAYAGGSADLSCSAGTRDSFASASGGNTVSATDPISFSACNNTPGSLVGGLFTIGGGADQASGTFSGTLVGLSGGGGGISDGTYEITSALGAYESVDLSGIFEVITGEVGT